MNNKEKSTHGLIVVNRDNLLEEDPNLKILHMVLFDHNPTFDDYTVVYNSLATKDKLGFTKIINEVVILPAPENAVEKAITYSEDN